MEHWEYQELIDAIYETYHEFIDQGKVEREAYARAGDEFFNLGELEDTIVYVVLGEIIIQLKKGANSYIKAINEKLLSFDIDQYENELNEAEKNDLASRVKNVIEQINNVAID